MRWSYKTVHFSLKKDGLLGSAFLDEDEIEISLNEYGHAGWELVSLMEVNDGLIAVFKQSLSRGVASVAAPVPEEKVATIEAEAATEKSSFVPAQEETSTEPQPQEKNEGLEEADSDEDDVGSIRIL